MIHYVRSFMLWSCIQRNFPTTTWTRNEQTEQQIFNRSVVSFGGTIWLLLFLRRVRQDRFQDAIKTWICRLSLSPAYISSANQKVGNNATVTKQHLHTSSHCFPKLNYITIAPMLWIKPIQKTCTIHQFITIHYKDDTKTNSANVPREQKLLLDCYATSTSKYQTKEKRRDITYHVDLCWIVQGF